MPGAVASRAELNKAVFGKPLSGIGWFGKSPNNFRPERGFLFFNELRRRLDLAGKLLA